MKKDLDEIEKQIAELEKRKKEILDEEKNRKSEEMSKRQEEIQDAYDKFVKLLKAYEKDYNINVSISYNTTSGNPIKFKSW